MERSEWMLERRKGVGSSDSPAILGKSRWKTPLHVYLEKTGEMPPTPPTIEQVAGLELEPYVAKIYSSVLHRDVSRCDRAIYRHPDMGWLSCTPDFLVVRPEGVENYLLECKTSQSGDGWGDEYTDEVPVEYYIQAQHQMLVTGHRRVDFALLVRGVEFSTYTVGYDNAFAWEMVKVLADFWKMVQDRQAPAPDWSHPKTPELMRLLHGGSVVEQARIVEDERLLSNVAEYECVKRDLKALGAKKERLHAEILAAAAPAKTTLVNGLYEVRLSRVRRAGYTVEPGEHTQMRVKELK